MKKLISFVLVVMLLCSISVSAFADNATLVPSVDKNYKATNATELGTPETQIWLQVAAEGQIDVTVPLVLVFKTNIDGGFAQTAKEAYKLTNNGTADLTVTKIVAENETTHTNKMQLKAYPTNVAEFKATDNYAVKLSKSDGTLLLDANAGSNSGKATAGGLLLLPKAVKETGKDDVKTPVEVKVDMITGPLSFITKHDVSTTEGDNVAKLNEGYGAHVMTVTYTVAINANGDSMVEGAEIPTT